MRSSRSKIPARKLALLAALRVAMLSNTGCSLKPILNLLAGLAGTTGGFARTRGPATEVPKPDKPPGTNEAPQDGAGVTRPRRVNPPAIANESVVKADRT